MPVKQTICKGCGKPTSFTSKLYPGYCASCANKLIEAEMGEHVPNEQPVQ